MKIYLVQTANWEGDKVVYENVVAFYTRREAETVVREAQREDPCGHQYDEVVPIDVYRTRRHWYKGISAQQRAKVRKSKEAKA